MHQKKHNYILLMQEWKMMAILINNQAIYIKISFIL